VSYDCDKGCSGNTTNLLGGVAMTNEKAFQIVAVDMLGKVEVVANFIDYGLAEETLFRLQEGDDKYSPCMYTIEEIDL